MVQYVMDRVRVKVKAIGTLTTNREKVDEEVVVEIVQSLCAVPHEEESAEEVRLRDRIVTYLFTSFTLSLSV